MGLGRRHLSTSTKQPPKVTFTITGRRKNKLRNEERENITKKGGPLDKGENKLDPKYPPTRKRRNQSRERG